MLKPFLFLIYKNNLRVAIKYSEVYQYADDIVKYIKVH